MKSQSFLADKVFLMMQPFEGWQESIQQSYEIILFAVVSSKPRFQLVSFSLASTEYYNPLLQ